MKDFILNHVLPIVGCFLTYSLLTSLTHAVHQRITKGSLGVLNPTPWAFMLGNSIGWVVYASLTSDPYCFASSGPGVFISCWLNLAAGKLIYQEHASIRFRDSISKRCLTITTSSNSNKKDHESASTDSSNSDVDNIAILDQPFGLPWDQTVDQITFENPPVAHDVLVVGTVAFWTVIVALLTFVPMSHESQIFFVGLVVNINLVLFYVGPLSTVYMVLVTSDSSSIHRPTMILNTLNSILWTGYGIGRHDLFMSVPNGIGAALNVFLLVLCILFSRETRTQKSGCEDFCQEPEVKEYGACKNGTTKCILPIIQEAGGIS